MDHWHRRSTVWRLEDDIDNGEPPSCFGFLKCLLCCQDEFDDTVYIDIGFLNIRRIIRNIFERGSRSDDDYASISSSPNYSYHVLRESNFPNSGYARSSYAQKPLQKDNEDRQDLEAQQSSSSSSQANSAKLPQSSSSSSSVNQSLKSSSKLPQSSLINPSSSFNQSLKSSSKLPQSSLINPSSSSPPSTSKPSSQKLPQLQKDNEDRQDLETKLLSALLYKAQQSSYWQANSAKLQQSSYSSSSSSVNQSLKSSSKLPQSSLINPYSSSPPSRSEPSSLKLPPSLKPSLAESFTKTTTKQQGQTNYVLAENDPLPLYIIPQHIKDLIKKDIVPDVLKKSLSPSTYKDYFSVLLHAEDYYYEKWSNYKLLNVTLELHKATVFKKSNKGKKIVDKEENEDIIFVAFNFDDVPERRPFLLSRDLVHARPSGSEVEPFQGIFYRVDRGKNRHRALVQFDDDFHSQHHASRRYDISFSFNRVCLKRAHQALNSISDVLLENFLFPDGLTRKMTNPTPRRAVVSINKLNAEISSTVHQISSSHGSPPYLIASKAHLREPSRSGVIIREAVIQTYKTFPHCRILICSPSNSACDVLMSGLKKALIPESDMLRANAAFREKEDVPADILRSSPYKDECFVCPRLPTLRAFKVIFSTFVSSFRLHKAGLPVGHFSHIFMVDASFAIEPEALVPLANFANEKTVVVVAGEVGTSSSWVRSEIGRRNGLKTSYFERLNKCRTYQSGSPEFITQLDL